MATTSLKEKVTDEAYTTLISLEKNFNKLYAACTTNKERDSLRHTLVAARDAYWRAERENLQDDNEFVTNLLLELEKTNKEIKQKLQNFQDVVAVIKLFTEAVKLVSAITALAAL